MQDLSHSPSFIHLRCHSEYSIVDGIVRIKDYVNAAQADAMPALALTDLSNLFGAVKFYKAARKQGIKAVLGADVWLENSKKTQQATRALLLVQNDAGYKLLCELLSKAYLENQTRGRPELKPEWFQQSSEGLILLSGNNASDIGLALAQNNAALATKLTSRWSALFPNRFYLEVQRAADAENAAKQEAHVQQVLSIASTLNVPVVATHPIQFITQDDFQAHEARTCIAEGYMLADRRRPKKFSNEQYFKTQEQMSTLFADIPEALANTIQIAKRCNLTLTLGENYLPNFPTPEGQDLQTYLAEKSLKGLNARLVKLFPDEAVRSEQFPTYKERLDFECGVIGQMGFPGYFLIVADFINWAKNNGVPVGPGRGSGAGSLVAYSLGITDLDPLEYNLLFERFLNPERVSMPDFDIDFCQDGRDRVIDYVKQKYGLDSVSQIATFGTMAAKAVIRDVGRVLDLPFNFVDSVAKLIPLELGITLKSALEKEPQLQERCEKEEEVAKLLELALRLEGVVRNVGMHAGGVLIAPGKISDYSAIYCQENGDSLVSQYDKDDVEAVGLVKFDFLGLRTLTILDMAVDNANAKRLAEGEPPLVLETLPLDDKAAFRLLKQSNTTAVFQLESKGMKDMLKQAKPDCFEDIIALVALYRPGPMDLIPDYCRRKQGQQRVVYPHPSTEVILKETYGIAVYQEQVMQIAQVVAGFSLGAADLLRRAMGKKKPEEMVKQREIFNEGALKNDLSLQQSNDLFDLLEKFAGYGFNKSHAAAYALVAYQTAYLKVHYPAAFLAATMSADMNNTDSMRIFFDDCAPNEVEVLPPDVNQSAYRFTPLSKDQILYGLGAIKGTGATAIDLMTAAREEGGPFKDLFDFCSRLDLRKVNRRVIESLIRAGAFDQLEPNRAALMAGVSAAIGAAEHANNHVGQDNLFGEETNVQHQLPAVEAWRPEAQLKEEKAALGFYLSGHPYTESKAEIAQFVHGTLADIAPQKQPKRIAGVVMGVRIRMTQRGKMAIVTLDDAVARVDVVVGGDLLAKHGHLIKEDQVLVIEGRISHDDFSGGNRVSANKLFNLPMARSAYASMLKIACNGQSDAAKLTTILQPYRKGESTDKSVCPVKIEYHNASSQVDLMLGESWQVELQDDLIHHLETWLSKDNVKILYN
ncbi:MAG: DNA polymerase-3 subunit alpha [Methylophilaceae bacterium]|jgi:DNA polymerase-3 subunit alpha